MNFLAPHIFLSFPTPIGNPVFSIAAGSRSYRLVGVRVRDYLEILTIPGKVSAAPPCPPAIYPREGGGMAENINPP